MVITRGREPALAVFNKGLLAGWGRTWVNIGFKFKSLNCLARKLMRAQVWYNYECVGLTWGREVKQKAHLENAILLVAAQS